jgi:hypothetical protein
MALKHPTKGVVKAPKSRTVNQTTPPVSVADNPLPSMVAEEPPEAETGMLTQQEEEADETTTLAAMRTDGSTSLEVDFNGAADHNEVETEDRIEDEPMLTAAADLAGEEEKTEEEEVKAGKKKGNQPPRSPSKNSRGQKWEPVLPTHHIRKFCYVAPSPVSNVPNGFVDVKDAPDQDDPWGDFSLFSPAVKGVAAPRADVSLLSQQWETLASDPEAWLRETRLPSTPGGHNGIPLFTTTKMDTSPFHFHQGSKHPSTIGLPKVEMSLRSPRTLES